MNKHNFVHHIDFHSFEEYFREEEKLEKLGKVRKYIGNSQQAEVRWIKEKYGIECRMWPIALLTPRFISAFSPDVSNSFKIELAYYDQLLPVVANGLGPKWCRTLFHSIPSVANELRAMKLQPSMQPSNHVHDSDYIGVHSKTRDPRRPPPPQRRQRQ